MLLAIMRLRAGGCHNWDKLQFDAECQSAVLQAAADIVSILANNGNGTVAVSSATSFTGTAANVAAVASSGDVTTGTNFNSTLSSGTAAASDIAAIEAGNGSGTIDGSSVTRTITGSSRGCCPGYSRYRHRPNQLQFDADPDSAAAWPLAADNFGVRFWRTMVAVQWLFPARQSFTGNNAANVAAVASSSDVTTGTNFNSTLSDSWSDWWQLPILFRFWRTMVAVQWLFPARHRLLALRPMLRQLLRAVMSQLGQTSIRR